MKPSIRATVLVLIQLPSLCLLGLVHVGDELREVNGIAVLHKRPDEISQILVRVACSMAARGRGCSSETQHGGFPARAAPASASLFV